MTHLLYLLLTCLLFTGCGPRYVDYFPYYDNGMPKPKIALLPVLDCSNANLPWDLSDELYQSFDEALMNSGKFYLLSGRELPPLNNQSVDFFGNDLSFTKEFCLADFIVTLEVLEHTLKYCNQVAFIGSADNKHLNATGDLFLKFRIKIIDTRYENPRIILYEILKSNYKISPPYDVIDYNKLAWGTVGYPSTPYAKAHQRMIQNILLRIEHIIRDSCT